MSTTNDFLRRILKNAYWTIDFDSDAMCFNLVEDGKIIAEYLFSHDLLYCSHEKIFRPLDKHIGGDRAIHLIVMDFFDNQYGCSAAGAGFFRKRKSTGLTTIGGFESRTGRGIINRTDSDDVFLKFNNFLYSDELE